MSMSMLEVIPMMMKIERHKRIIWLIKQQGFARVAWLAKQLHVTPETIRTDLNELSDKGMVQRCHGGAAMEVSALDDVAQEEIISCLSCEARPVKDRNERNQKNKRGDRGDKGDRRERKERKENEATGNKVCVLGSFNVDMISYLPRLPTAGESLLGTQFLCSAGGKGSNQALAASRAGAQTHFIAKVGADQFSSYAADFLETSGIQSSTIYQSDEHPTGTALIFVDQGSGENMIAITPGANMAIGAHEVRMQQDKIAECDIILLQLETNQEALRESIAIAREHGIAVMLNPAPYGEIVHELLPLLDYLSPNQTEAALISGIDITDEACARQAAEIIHSKGVGTVIITLGAAGALAYDGQDCIHVPAFAAVVKNTAGAGDAFNGALAAALAKGGSLRYALYYACAFASLAVETDSACDMPQDSAVMNRIMQAEACRKVFLSGQA